MRTWILGLLVFGLAGCGPRMLYDAGAQDFGHAVWKGSPAEVEKLIDDGADPEAKVPVSGGTPIHIAAQKGDVPMLEMLLKRGAHVDLIGGDFDFWTPLTTASRYGQLDAVKFLLAHGANVNGTKDANPLQYAATIPIAQELLDHGASLTKKDRYGSEPLDTLLARQEHWPVVKFLIEKGAKPASVNGAVYEHDPEMVKYLLEKGAPVNEPGNYNHPAIHVAVAEGLPEMVALLKARGANLEAKNHNGQTPLMIAVEAGRNDLVQLLIKLGADVDATGELKRTALHVACSQGQLECAQSLLAAGADVNARDEHGWTPLFRACTNDYKGIVKLLIAKGADLNAQDADAQTAADWARHFERSNVVAILEAAK